MKFTTILKNIILEASRSALLYDKYVKPTDKSKKGVMTFEDFLRLIYTDPTTRPDNIDLQTTSVNDLESIHPGKYSQWILNIFNNPKLTDETTGNDIEVGSREYKIMSSQYKEHFMEDLDQFKGILKKYERFKGSLVDASKKDINNIKSFPELFQLQVKVGNDSVDLSLYQGKKIKKEKGVDVNKNFNVPGAEILKVGSEYTLIRISDKGDLGSKAASYFGGYDGGVDRGETNWCTAADCSTYSHNYRQKGPLYIIIANEDNGKVGQVTGLPSERYQLHFPEPSQFKSRNQHGPDGNIPIVEWLNGKWSEFKEILKPEFAAGVTVGGKVFKVDNFTSGSVGKFIALYGLEDLFKSLPDSLETLKIKDNGKNDFIIKIPDDIDRFQNVEFLNFENCIDSIPESVCNMKKLRFLTLQGNSKLRTVPGCIANLPNLVFLNVKECPNLQIPQEISDNANDFGNGMWDFAEDED